MSPVTHDECIRISTGSSSVHSPLVRATCSSPLLFWRNGVRRNIPHLVGMSTVAPFDDRLFAQTVGDQIGDGDDFQVEFLRHFEQLRQAGHRAVLVHDLDQSAAGLQSGQTGQIDGRFGMSRPAQHPLLAGT